MGPSPPGATTLNMGHMANLLPDYRAPTYGAHPFQQGYNLSANSNPPQMYQYQPNPQLAGQTRAQYDPAFTQQFPDQFLPGQQARSTSQNFAPSPGYQPSYPQGPQHFPPQSYYQTQHQTPQNFSTTYVQTSQAYANPNQTLNPYAQTYGNRSSTGQPMTQLRQGGAYFYGPAIQTGTDTFFPGSLPAGSSYIQSPDPSMLSSVCLKPACSALILCATALTRQSSDSSLRPSVPRGPPRKPKQSGHALWVGNLPPGTHIADLKEHFSRDATKDIESVFLISKSNCAFVNYKNETACAAAMTRFHDSRFQGVRLVCRLRRGSAATSSGTPVGPSSGPSPSEGVETRTSITGETTQEVAEPETLADSIADEELQPEAKVKEKFFVVKSLTVEDLDMSVRNGIWATQTHNEAALNKAYEVRNPLDLDEYQLTDGRRPIMCT